MMSRNSTFYFRVAKELKIALAWLAKARVGRDHLVPISTFHILRDGGVDMAAVYIRLVY